jgi:hypothetical protein
VELPLANTLATDMLQNTKSAKLSRRRKGRRRGNPRGDPGPVAVSAAVPQRNYLSTHVAGVSQSIRRVLAWSTSSNTGLSAAGYQESTVVLLNSPYDPDTALGGVSAAGFAKYMALYSKCFAIGARARVKYLLGGNGALGPPPSGTYVGATITTSTSSLGSLSAAIQAGLVDYHVRNQHPDSGMLELSVDIARFVDKPDILDDPQFYCTNAANPGQLIALHLWVNAINAATAYALYYTLEVEMTCIFTDPIPFS